MNSSGKTASATASPDAEDAACPLTSPLIGRVPGWLSLAAMAAAFFTGAPFFSMAGALLAVISLLLSPPRCRVVGVAGLIGAVASGLAGAVFPAH
jgi:hypothetical protein